MAPIEFIKSWFVDSQGSTSSLRVGVTSSLMATGLIVAIASTSKSVRKWIAGILGSRSPGWGEPSLRQIKLESRVLIIDDESLAHFEHLKHRGFSCEHWKTIDRSRSGAIDAEFDLLLLDVRGVQDAFGAKDGIEALELLRRDNPWIPIALNTAFPADVADEKRRTVKMLTQRSLAKMMRYAEFEEAVVQLLQLGRSRQYFIDVLSRLQVADPGSVLTELESIPKSLPQWSFLPNTKPSSVQRDQVDQVLRTAQGVYTRVRWGRRKG